MTANAKIILRGHDDRAAIRQPRESEWQLICDYCLPRKDMTITPVPGQLRQRRVSSGVGQVALRRSAALVLGHMIDPAKPFIKPNPIRGLTARGRSRELDDEGRDFLTHVEWDMFDRMMLPQSGFMTSGAGVSLELLGLGSAVQWTGRKRGFGPKYQRRPLRSCWFGEGDDGDIDTLDYCWSMPAWQVIERYPEADKVERIRKLAADDKTCQTPVELMHTVLPRKSGGAGRVATEKPFADVIILKTDMVVIAESGWEDFPFAVPRLNVEDGSPYGSGLAWEVLPDIIVYSHLQSAIERGVDLRVDPPMWSPTDLIDGPIDRRAGAMNFYDAVNLGFQNLRDAVQKMDVAGDPGIGVEYMRFLRENIEAGLFIDWMRDREGAQMTATEYSGRRDLRLRSMSAIVPPIDREWMGKVADRTLAVMVEEDQLPPTPRSLGGVEVDWDYAGPLAMAQQQGQGEAIVRLFDAAERAANLDPKSLAVLELSEGLRELGEAFGVPASVLRSRQRVAEIQQEQAAREEEARQAEVAKNAGSALQGGAQGIASLAAIGGGQLQAA